MYSSIRTENCLEIIEILLFCSILTNDCHFFLNVDIIFKKGIYRNYYFETCHTKYILLFANIFFPKLPNFSLTRKTSLIFLCIPVFPVIGGTLLLSPTTDLYRILHQQHQRNMNKEDNLLT